MKCPIVVNFFFVFLENIKCTNQRNNYLVIVSPTLYNLLDIIDVIHLTHLKKSFVRFDTLIDINDYY